MSRHCIFRISCVVLLSIFCLSFARGQNSQQQLQTHYQRAQEALRQQRYDEAAAEFQRILRLNPRVAEAHANLGVIYYTQRRYPEASEAFTEALKLKPSLSKAADFLAMVKAKTGHIDEALPLLEKAFKNSTDEQLRQQAGLFLVELYYGRRELDKALDVVQTLQKRYPENPEVLYVAYRMYSDLGARAVSGLARASPSSARLHQVTAELLESEGDFPRAVEQYRKALEMDPTLPGIHRALGVAIMSAAQSEASLLEAEKHFGLELAINPGDAHSEYQLGEIDWARHQIEQARKRFTRAIELLPNFTDALIALGKVLISQAQPDKALNYLQQAVRIDPENEVAYYRLAEAYRKLGMAQEAEQALGQFKRLREASASIGTVYRQVQRNPVIGQTIEGSDK